MTIVEGQNTIWITRLDESLTLLDKLAGKPCECNADWGDGVVCIQCHARKVQTCIREGGSVSNGIVQDAYEQVICHVDDYTEGPLSKDHELESVRYWASKG